MADPKRIVYIIRSLADPNRFYTGLTSNIEARLDWHNNGPCGYTLNYLPWVLLVALTFSTETSARRFER